jgi:hypothetical protein
MFELWMQVPSERKGFGVDRWVGAVNSYQQANDIARNLINITGNNVWIEEV